MTFVLINKLRTLIRCIHVTGAPKRTKRRNLRAHSARRKNDNRSNYRRDGWRPDIYQPQHSTRTTRHSTTTSRLQYASEVRLHARPVGLHLSLTSMQLACARVVVSRSTNLVAKFIQWFTWFALHVLNKLIFTNLFIADFCHGNSASIPEGTESPDLSLFLAIQSGLVHNWHLRTGHLNIRGYFPGTTEVYDRSSLWWIW